MLNLGKNSKREAVREYLLTEVRSGKYPPGTRFSSENHLTRELGISKNTLREAISSLVTDGVFYRVQGSGTYVQEVPNDILKQITLIVCNPHRQGSEDVFIGALLSGLHTELDARNWQIRLKMFPDLDRSKTTVEEFIRENTAGSAVMLAGFNFTREITDMLLAAKMRVVTIGRPEASNIPYIHTDHVAGMRTTVEALLAKGHRQIALIDRRASHQASYDERRESFLNTLGEAGVVPDARLLIDYEGFGIEGGADAARLLLRRNVPFTAVIVYGDWGTLGVRRGLEQAGMEIPRDVSMICYGKKFDDIASVCWKTSEMSMEGAEMLIQPELKESHRLINVTFYPGNSIKDIS